MMLTRFDQWTPVHQLRSEMDRLLNQFVDGSSANGGRRNWLGARGVPAINAWENEQNLYVEAELPGMKMEDLDLTVVGSELTIKGTRVTQEDEQLTYHRRERGTGTFTRTLRLPTEVDGDKVGATLKDGVLTITLPKAEAAKPRKIKIQGG